MKKITTLFMASTMMAFTSTQVDAQDVETFNVNSTDVAVFESGNIQTIESSDKLEADTTDFQINYQDGEVDFSVSVDQLEEPITVKASLVPGQLDLFEDNVLLGTNETINDAYELKSLRIEENATNDTLIQPNHHLEGKTVLHLGIQDKDSNDIYYLQQSLEDADVRQMMSGSQSILEGADHDRESLEALELRYLTFNDGNQASETTEGTLEMSQEDALSEMDEDPPVNPQGTIDSRVPDDIFKSTEHLDGWETVSDLDRTDAYVHSSYTQRFAGTDSLLTFFVMFDIIRTNDFEDQEYALQMEVSDNMSVFYSASNDNLFNSRDDFDDFVSPVIVEDLELFNRSNTVNGVFNTRAYYGATTDLPDLENIGRAAIQWVDYASTALSNYDELTASHETNTDHVYRYDETAEEQRDRHDEIINRIEILEDESEFVEPGDYLLLETQGSRIESINQGYSYTAWSNYID